MTTTTNNPPQEKWWAPLLFGIISIILGLFFLLRPGITSVVAAKFIGIYWVVSGIIQLVHMFQDRTAWGWKLFLGIVSILAGLFLVFASPLEAILGLGSAIIIVMGVWGLFMGIMLLIGAFKGAGWGAGIMGALSIFLGLILLRSPWAGALALPFVAGIFLIAGGIANIFQAFRLR